MTKQIKSLLEQHKFSIKNISINNFIRDIRFYQDDLVILPSFLFSIVAEILKEFENPFHQNVIILSNNSNNIWRKGKSFGSLHVLDYIHLDYDNEKILFILNKHFTNE